MKILQVETSGGPRLEAGPEGGGRRDEGRGAGHQGAGVLACPDLKQVTRLYYTKLQT